GLQRVRAADLSFELADRYRRDAVIEDGANDGRLCGRKADFAEIAAELPGLPLKRPSRFTPGCLVIGSGCLREDARCIAGRSDRAHLARPRTIRSFRKHKALVVELHTAKTMPC